MHRVVFSVLQEFSGEGSFGNSQRLLLTNACLKPRSESTSDTSVIGAHEYPNFFWFRNFSRGRIHPSFWGINDIREIRKLDLVNYKESLEKREIKGKTLKNYLSLFKTFLRYCQNDLEVIASIPPMPQVQVQESKFKWLPQEDQIKLYEHVPEGDKPIFAFLMLHGCRPSEARALKVKDVDRKLKTITISATFSGSVYRQRRKGRGAKSVTIPIHPEMADFIIERANKNLPEAFLFANPRTGENYSKTALERVWANAREKAGVGGLRLYDATRHSFASNLVNNGTSIFKVSRLLGHSSISMTEKYSHQNIESLRIDLQKLSLGKVATVPRVSPEQKIRKNN
jgi:integrase